MKRRYKVVRISTFGATRDEGFTGSWTACRAYCAELGWVVDDGIIWSLETVPLYEKAGGQDVE